jgi:hypothetical protein
MNYKKIYDNFIISRKNRVIDETLYYEKHHILPKSLGGDDSSNNLIKLTAREHYFAHLLLSKFAGPKMVIALTYFLQETNRYGGGVKFTPSSKSISKIRENANKVKSEIMKGREFSESHKQNISKSKLGIPAHNKNVPASEEQKKKQSNSMKGKTPWNKGLVGEEHLKHYKNGKIKVPNMTGYKWINNGFQQTKIPPEKEIPEGWKRGRIDLSGDNNPMRKRK